MTSTGSFDFIVVGAGTAGCVIASRLSTRGSVLLLEGGGDDRDEKVREDVADPAKVFAAIFEHPRIGADGQVQAVYTSDVYTTEPQAHLDQRAIRIDQGTIRGGSSSINGMIYVRGSRRDYDDWAAQGNYGWDYASVLPYFLKSENYAGSVSAYHAAGGPLDVGHMVEPSPAALAFVDAARQVFPQSHRDWDFNGPQQEQAAGLYQVNVTPQRRRASAATAFLDKVADGKNLTVELGVQATGVVIEKNRAVGVEVLRRKDGQRASYRAEAEVIIAAGTFESPKLLMLSGIGPAAQLRAHGIAPRVDLPGVGQNLHDHLELLIYYPSTVDPGDAEFSAEAGLFFNSQNPLGHQPPDLQFHVLGDFPGKASIAKPGEKRPFLICPVLCRPQSRGSLRLRSADPQALPVIDPRYLESGTDMQLLLRGIEWAEHFARLGELSKLFDRNTLPFVVSRPPAGEHKTLGRAPAERAALVREAVQSVWHPVGTCKMGPDTDLLAVVNPRLQVRGVENLRVADASIMPAITTGNTNAVCYMIGERCVGLIP